MLKFIREIVAKAPKPGDQAPAMTVGGEPFTPVARPNAVTGNSETNLPAPGAKHGLGDTLCIIEYRDADGWETRRRITMRSIAPGPNCPLLNAVCHEAQGYRQFRTDRITAVITEDGELVSFRQFLIETFDLDLDQIGVDVSTTIAQALRMHLRPALALLIGAAQADSHRHALEMDAIEIYVENEAFALFADGKLRGRPTAEMFERLNNEIARKRPQADEIARAALTVARWDQHRVERLARAMQKVIRADGRIHGMEVEFVADLNALVRTSRQDFERMLGIDGRYSAADIFADPEHGEL